MRSSTGRSGFDETLQVSDGRLEASFRVDLEALRIDMEDWLGRKFGEGHPVKLRLTDLNAESRSEEPRAPGNRSRMNRYQDDANNHVVVLHNATQESRHRDRKERPLALADVIAHRHSRILRRASF